MNVYMITNVLFIPTPVHSNPIDIQVNPITQKELEQTMATYLGVPPTTLITRATATLVPHLVLHQANLLLSFLADFIIVVASPFLFLYYALVPPDWTML